MPGTEGADCMRRQEGTQRALLSRRRQLLVVPARAARAAVSWGMLSSSVRKLSCQRPIMACCALRLPCNLDRSYCDIFMAKRGGTPPRIRIMHALCARARQDPAIAVLAVGASQLGLRARRLHKVTLFTCRSVLWHPAQLGTEPLASVLRMLHAPPMACMPAAAALTQQGTALQTQQPRHGTAPAWTHEQYFGLRLLHPCNACGVPSSPDGKHVLGVDAFAWEGQQAAVTCRPQANMRSSSTLLDAAKDRPCSSCPSAGALPPPSSASRHASARAASPASVHLHASFTQSAP